METTIMPPVRDTLRNKAESARWLLLSAAILSLALAYIPGAELVTYPLSLFRTYVHEGGHAIVTVLTGGSVEFVRIAQNTSGVTGSRGGFYPLICSAGYIGATTFGLICLLLNRRPGSGKRTLILMAAVVLLIVSCCCFLLPPIPEVRNGERWQESAVSVKGIGLAFR